jgi:hypothetical protein
VHKEIVSSLFIYLPIATDIRQKNWPFLENQCRNYFMHTYTHTLSSTVCVQGSNIYLSEKRINTKMDLM